MKTQCTWVDCPEVAAHPQIGQDGKEWANLCDVHAKELDDSLLDPKAVLRCWVRASGGPKVMAEKMMASPEGKETVKLAQKLGEKLSQKGYR
jgi:hypothetical protein